MPLTSLAHYAGAASTSGDGEAVNVQRGNLARSVRHGAAVVVLLAAGTVAAPAAAPNGDRTMPAHDYASTRYSPLATINRANVRQLKVGFTFSTGVNRGQEAAPIVVGNRRRRREHAVRAGAGAPRPAYEHPRLYRLRRLCGRHAAAPDTRRGRARRHRPRGGPGPTAGYFARGQGTALHLAPVTPWLDTGEPMIFDISMGVRREDRALRRELDAALERNRAAIARVLDEYGVPQLPMGPAAAAPGGSTRPGTP
jgi:hypothetical protein